MKKGGLVIALFVLFISFIIGIYWERLDSVREGVHFVLDPTFGRLIGYNSLIGFIITVAIISLALTLAQKYLTNQEELKKLKAQQKAIQKEAKQYKNQPEKMMELNKKTLEVTPKMLQLSMSHIAYTALPIILFFRWFQEILSPIYGGWWLFYYIILTLIFSSILRKALKVA